MSPPESRLNDADLVARECGAAIAAHLAGAVPELAGEFRARSSQCVFVAWNAR